MDLSIIIPTFNEEETIAQLISHLNKGISRAGTKAEIIVVDGGSQDQTAEEVRQLEVNFIQGCSKGRSSQLNEGARHAGGDILYFVHADSFPPLTFVNDITGALENGAKAGCFRYQFKSNHPLLKINAFCTRFNLLSCRGGDQTLFITQELFDKLGGYKEKFRIMEDFELIERIQKYAQFKIIPKNAMVSARKYHYNSYLRVQIANLIVFSMYRMNFSQQVMIDMYTSLIQHPKL